MWRFESNGWPRDLPYPLARDDDSKPQAGRTSTAEHMAYLKAEVDQVLRRTGAKQVVLVANSRGGNAVRNYVQNGGGAATVSHAILGGTPNRGYFDFARDRMSLDGKPLPGVGPGGAGLSSAKLKLKESGVRAEAAEFNGEKLTGRTWSTSENRVVMLELTY